MELLKNKLALITGASSGIGRACAYKFAAEGANLILTARRADRLKEISSDLKKKFQSNIYTLEFDIRSYKKVKDSISNLPEEWREIEFLINNAGLARGFSKIFEGEIEHWEEMIDTNIKGLLYITREVLPIMVKRKSGHIINIGSTAGHEVYANGNVYCATKYAVNALTQSIRLDVLDKNVKVSTVDPGMVRTEFSDVRFSGDKEKVEKVYEGVIPLSADDIAEAVLFCATRPPHVNINEIIMTPAAQASSTQIYRKAER
jgi:NADP-dependent 3-hydroxy acid dehydrogenase YdfG